MDYGEVVVKVPAVVNNCNIGVCVYLCVLLWPLLLWRASENIMAASLARREIYCHGLARRENNGCVSGAP